MQDRNDPNILEIESALLADVNKFVMFKANMQRPTMVGLGNGDIFLNETPWVGAPLVLDLYDLLPADFAFEGLECIGSSSSQSVTTAMPSLHHLCSILHLCLANNTRTLVQHMPCFTSFNNTQSCVPRQMADEFK